MAFIITVIILKVSEIDIILDLLGQFIKKTLTRTIIASGSCSSAEIIQLRGLS